MVRVLLLLVFLLPAAAWADDDRPERKVADPELQGAINSAIDAGVSFLKQTQDEDGSWGYDAYGRGFAGQDAARGGMTAMALYALSASRVPAGDDAVVRGLAWIAAHPEPFAPGARYGTYSASLLVLALTRIDPTKYKRRIRKLADTLVASQLEGHMWSYGLRAPPSRYARSPREPERGEGRQRGGRRTTVGDNSNSQFAVLALWAAREIAGVAVPDETWKRVLLLYASTQAERGGWPYRAANVARGGRATGVRSTMTAAGLVSYVYAFAALRGGAAALPEAWVSSVARLGLRAFLRLARPPWRDHYLLYSVERVGTVLGRPPREWYDAGARDVVGTQKADGGWGGAHGARGGNGRRGYETSLALLFLSRATAYAITPR